MRHPYNLNDDEFSDVARALRYMADKLETHLLHAVRLGVCTEEDLRGNRRVVNRYRELAKRLHTDRCRHAGEDPET